MEEKFCSICFDNENNESLILLECNHIFHFECINEWYKKGDNKKFDKPLTCPYCRSVAFIKSIPIKYDCFFKFYYFTHFKREMCVIQNCSNKEFPLNNKTCSKHFYPFIDKNDLNKIMNYLFPFFFIPLNIKKFILNLCIEFYKHDLNIDQYIPCFLVLIKNFLLQNDFLPQSLLEILHIFYDLQKKYPELKYIHVENDVDSYL